MRVPTGFRSTGTFAFWIARIRSDVSEVVALRETYGAEPRDIAGNLTQIPPSRSAELTQFASDETTADWRWRAASVLVRCAGEHVDQRDLASCYELAFDDLDSRVRGCCWWVIGRALRRRHFRSILTGPTLATLKYRFVDIQQIGSLDAIANVWLNQIASSATLVDMRFKRRAIERAYIEAHAADDAALILSHGVIAESYLDHPAPGRRLAALMSVRRSRSISDTGLRKIQQMMASDSDERVRRAALETYRTFKAPVAPP